MALSVRRGAAAVLLVPLALVALAGPALAHPLGNFTTNTFAGITVAPEAVRVSYVIDLAEIPALQEIQRVGLDADRPDASGYGMTRCADITAELELRVAGAEVALEVADARLSFPPGQAGLDTLRLECDLTTGTLEVDEGTAVTLTDEVLASRLGWREIVAVGDGLGLASTDVPAETVSGRLTEYPEDLLQSPLDVRSAALVAGAPAPRLMIPGAPDPVAETANRAIDALTSLVSAQELTVGFVLLAFAAAIGLGALHALAPGHGKTVMAAFLIGRSGAGRQALGLGLTVAVTHTAGVLVLGLLLSASQIVAPERVFGWLGAASGLLFSAVGVVMLRSALRNRGSDHSHGHDHGHDHDHDHDHADERARTMVAPGAGRSAEDSGAREQGASDQGNGHDGDRHDGHGHGHQLPAPGSGWRGLIAPGLAGGLVPSPSALVVLLGGLALGRAWFGVSLVVAYGIGMAGTLVGIGFLLVRARDRFAARVAAAAGEESRIVRITRQLPVVMASLIIIGGLVIVVRFGLNPMS